MGESSVLTPETPRRTDHIAYMRAREREIACCYQRYRSERALRRPIFVLWIPGDKWIDLGYRAESGGATIEGRSHRARQEGRDYEPASVLLERIREHHVRDGKQPRLDKSLVPITGRRSEKLASRRRARTEPRRSVG
jgi:hypothetical protein